MEVCSYTSNQWNQEYNLSDLTFSVKFNLKHLLASARSFIIDIRVFANLRLTITSMVKLNSDKSSMAACITG